MSRGYYRGRVDGNYGGQTAFAIRAFQSSAGLMPTGRLDTETLEALGQSDADFAYSAPRAVELQRALPSAHFASGCPRDSAEDPPSRKGAARCAADTTAMGCFDLIST